MDYVNHLFMPGYTLEGVIRKVVRHDLPKAEVLRYVAVFNEINGYPVIRPGVSYRIPTSLNIVDGEGNAPD